MGTTSGRPKEHVGSIGVHTWERRYGGVVNVNREAAAASAPVVCNEGRKRLLPIFEGGRVGKPSAVCGVYHVLLTLNKGAHMGAGGLERAFEKPKERLWPKRERAQGVTVEMSARKQHVLERGTNDDGAGIVPKEQRQGVRVHRRGREIRSRWQTPPNRNDEGEGKGTRKSDV